MVRATSVAPIARACACASSLQDSGRLLSKKDTGLSVALERASLLLVLQLTSGDEQVRLDSELSKV